MALFYAFCAAALAGVIVYLAVFRRFVAQRDSASEHGRAHTGRVAHAASLASKIFPQTKEVGDRLRKRISGAGLTISPTTYHGISVVFYIAALVVLAPALSLLDMNPAAKIALAIVAAVIVALCPRALLAIKARKRRERIKVALPRALDLLAISIEAGLTPQRAIRIVAQKSTGPLAYEFGLADRDMAFLRYSLGEALERMADRCGVEALSQFVAALSAGTAVGAKVGDVLKSQSKHVFKRRTQELKAQSNKLPIKMIMPIGFLMLPDVILAFAAPIAISMVAKMSGVQ